MAFGCQRSTGKETPMGKSLFEVHRKGWGLVVLLVLAAGVVFAQTNSMQSLAASSNIIVRGKVLKTNSSDEPLLAPSARTAIISIEEMYAGMEIAGDQKGRTATVILSNPERAKAGEEMIFFGNARFLGKSLTIADEGEVEQAAGAAVPGALEQAVQARRDKPILDRMASASIIFRGTVSSIKPLEARGRGEQTSEHDPEWQVATIQVVKPLRDGAAGENVTVVFPASRDIVWFHAPKLKPGQDAVFLAHAAARQQDVVQHPALQELMQKQTIYLVTEPYDVLPPAQEDRVRGLLAAPKETK
jgi:hypothetical protein